jgi:UDPglucose 6-dehydrogenase
MRLCVVGSGYVGLVTAACLADTGNHVAAVDIDATKVAELNAGRSPIFEPGLEDLLQSNLRAGRLRFTTDTASAVAGARVIFLAVGTPPRDDGGADLAHICAAAQAVGAALTGPAVIVTKSTVPVGTGRKLAAIIAGETEHPFQMVSNPEFLKEGTAVDDFLRPDRVVIGADDREAAELLAELHRPFVRNQHPIMHMSLEAAELTKYASNAYLAARISFINEIAELCEKLGVNIDEVRQGMGADKRIGHHFLYPGVGYGGSCFPKDTQALVAVGKEVGIELAINAAVHQRNNAARRRLADQVIGRLGPDMSGRRVVVWGLAFKPNTDDVREAPAIAIVDTLLQAGATVAVHDPRALGKARAVLGGRVTYHDDAYEPLAGADALLTATEWMEYRSPDFERIRSALKQPLIFDGRNIYDHAMMRRHGFEYYSVGRPVYRPESAPPGG